jgi:hypothetical protein
MTRPRKQRRRDARWLVTGINAAAAIQHHGQTSYLLPVRSGDHPKRYSTGQRLALKPYVPGPTSAHLILARVERVYVGQVDDTTARELGYEGAETFRLAWVREHDGDDVPQGAVHIARTRIPRAPAGPTVAAAR